MSHISNMLFSNLTIDLVIVFVLIAYFFIVRSKHCKIVVPVGFFIGYFLIRSVIAAFADIIPVSTISILDLVALTFLVLGSIRLTVFIFIDYLLSHKKMVGVPLISRDIGLVVVYLFAVMIILRYRANVDLTSLLTTSAVVTVVIGLALQDTLGNLFAGIVLQLEKPYHIGDWVSFSNYTGRIVGMSWKSTKIITRDKEQVSIPNNVIAKSHILNYSQPDPYHMAAFELGISYDDPPNKVRDIILRTLDEHPQIHNDPVPEVRVIKFADSSVNYRVQFCISDFEKEERIKAHILNQLWYRFKREGITIPYPVRAIKHIEIDPDKVSTDQKLNGLLAYRSLRQVDVFRPLSDDDLKDLSNRVRFDSYSKNEFIVMEGVSGRSMYVIISGECEVVIDAGGSNESVVATLGANQFFGEMSLLTGEPRTATVRSKVDTVCIRIGKENFEGIIKAHPEIIGQVSEILAERKKGLLAQKDMLRQEVSVIDKNLASQLLSRIRTFFNV